jgi:ribosomal protein L37AE/L43A
MIPAMMMDEDDMGKGRKKKAYERNKEPAKCLTCNTLCVKVKGSDIYRLPAGASGSASVPDYYKATFWKCPACDNAHVGCHPGTDIPLGHAADRETRQMRARLHREMVDPLWQTVGDRGANRVAVYRFLGEMMDIEDPHIGAFTLDECKEAWAILSAETMKSILKFVERL